MTSGVCTGSSGIQAIPVIAEHAEQLYVFQRTPNFIIPSRNRPLDNETQAGSKRKYPELRAKGREIVNDPVIAKKLAPTDHPIGAKRICVASGYYETFNRPKVHRIDVREEVLEGINPAGLQTIAREYAVDIVVFATGYDALTGALTRIDIRGIGGQSVRDKWSLGPANYLGLMTAGFLNMFIITGPGSPSVLVNMVVGIEHYVDWIVDCLVYLRKTGASAIEATEEAEKGWVAHVNEVAGRTVFVKANSWYLGANIPGKPRIFLPYAGGLARYRAKCVEVAKRGYQFG